MANNELPNLDTLPASAMLSAADLAGLLRVSTNTVWRLAKVGRLPEPLRIGENTTRWKAGEVREALGMATAPAKPHPTARTKSKPAAIAA